MTRVETIVIDPGDLAFPNLNVDRSLFCIEAQSNGYTYKGVPHLWQILALGDKGATWMCTRCRRVERRIVHEGDE